MAIPILSPIGNFFKNIFNGSAFASTGLPRTNLWGIGQQEVYAPIEQNTAISKGFNANTAVYSIVKKYAKKAASIEKYLEDKNSDEPYDDNHPLMLLLRRPNERQSQAIFFKLVFASYKLFGEAFIWLNRGDVTQSVNEFGQLVDRTSEQIRAIPVIEMFCIPANHIVIIPNPEDPFKVLGYQLRNRPQIKFSKNEMIHWIDLNLDWDEFSRPQLRGMTPLKPGFKTLTADNSLIDSMVRMAQNDGAKGVLYNEILAKMTPEQQTQLDMVMSDKINNKDIKNAVAALQGKWGYLDLGLTSVDMDTLGAREFIYKEFCFLLDVPYGFFDSHTPYAEKQLAARDWISNSIMPDCKELDGELNRELLPSFGLSLQVAEICTDYDSLPEMQEDFEKKVVALNQAPVTPNEFREAIGYEQITDDPIMDEVRMPGTSSSIQGDPNMQMDAAGNPLDPNGNPIDPTKQKNANQ